ncbi:MAG: DUF4391 domain-containing protein [Bacillaceae bacterium]|nr:DUF4391 domain-containing protein [Bacillaceae bacterium]
MKDWLVERLGIPKRTVVNRKISKKVFFTQADFSIKDKELFTAEIESIHLVSVMNQDSMNIPSLKTEDVNYSEVVWVWVLLREIQYVNRIINTIHKSIPNPVILFMESPEGNMLVSTSHKRLSKTDVTKIVFEQPTITEWFPIREVDYPYNKLLDALTISNLSYKDLYDFYDDIHCWLESSKIISLMGTFPKEKDSRTKIITLLNDFNDSHKEIERLQNAQKGQLDFGAKMELHMKIKQKEQQTDILLQHIKELC